MMVMKQLRSAVVIGYMLSITWIRRNLLSLVGSSRRPSASSSSLQ